MYIYLAFYISTEKGYTRSRKSIEDVIHEYFGGSVSLFSTESVRRVSEDSDSDAEVLIYSLRKPVLKETVAMQKFFSDLEKVFSILNEYSPHFTQESEYYVEERSFES